MATTFRAEWVHRSGYRCPVLPETGGPRSEWHREFTLSAKVDGIQFHARHKELSSSPRVEEVEFTEFIKRQLAKKIAAHVTTRILGEL